MNYYQHYSFDLWLTLIKSNPEFKIRRTIQFHRDYNINKKSIDEVAAAFRQVDLMCNAINESTGKNIDSEEMYLMVISLINDGRLNFNDMDIVKLCDDMDALLFNYMPVVYNPVTIEVLHSLKHNSGSTFSLLSNTGFIKGRVLRKVMEELKMGQYFDFQLYSDEAGMSKPNPLFFNLMLDNVIRVNPTNIINLDEIIHVGDNPLADVAGAEAAGIKGLLINSNNLSINSLIN